MVLGVFEQSQRIPRITNSSKNIFSQLGLKLNPAIKFGSHESAWNTAKCLISWYRFKKFSGCCKTHMCKGKAPLELAKGETQKSTLDLPNSAVLNNIFWDSP